MRKVIAVNKDNYAVIEVAKQGPPGAGGDSFYVRPTPMSITVGGAVTGTSFNGSIQDCLDIILYPYQDPTFTNFDLFGFSTLEVGAAIPAGNLTFSWNTSNSENIIPDTISIRNSSDGITYVTDSSNDGLETVTIASDVQRVTSGAKTFTIYAKNTKDLNISRNYNVNWYWKVWYGESTNTSLDTEEEVESLRVGQLRSSVNGTYSFLGGGYKWIAYPTLMGLKSNFTDVATGFPVAMEVPITVSLTNAYGITTNYYVHRTYNVLGGSINIAVS
jgi:hypothetical protein